MLKKTITYTDYNDNQRTEDFYFNLSKAELIEMQMSANGGMDAMLNRIVNEQDMKGIMNVFKELVLKAVGVKSDDGKRFIKTPEISAAFEQSEAYSELVVMLLSDENAAAEFINGIIPKSIAEELAKHPEMLNKPQ